MTTPAGCAVFLEGDSDPFWIAMNVSEILAGLETADDRAPFVPLVPMPKADDERYPAPIYVRYDKVVAIDPLDPREVLHSWTYDELPGWLK
jgi:hypothetical protein